MSEIDDFLRNLQSTSVSIVGTDANAARDPLAGDWRIDDASMICITQADEVYWAVLVAQGNPTDSAPVTKVSASAVWEAHFVAFTMHLIPFSADVINVCIDFGQGEVARFGADRILALPAMD